MDIELYDNLIVDIDGTLIYGGMCDIKSKIWNITQNPIISSILSWLEQKLKWYKVNHKVVAHIFWHLMRDKRVIILTARKEIKSTVKLIKDILKFPGYDFNIEIVQLGSYNPDIDKTKYILDNIEGDWKLIDDNLMTLARVYYTCPNGVVVHPEEL